MTLRFRRRKRICWEEKQRSATLRIEFFLNSGRTISLSGNVTGNVAGDSLFISAAPGFLGNDTLEVTAVSNSGASTTDVFVVTVAPSLGIGDAFTNRPADFYLLQNYPNPFNPATVIEYQLPVAGEVELKVFTSLGEHVQTLVREWQAAGRYQASWNGKNSAGAAVSSGIYLYRLEAGSGVQITKKMVLLR